MRLNLNSDLVTLSACSTGPGKLVNGEGMLGLTRSLFYAGARSVAVSLWNVNDSATAKLMESFYRNLNGNLPKGEAMRKAKLSLLHATNAVWQHPYFWSAFIVAPPGPETNRCPSRVTAITSSLPLVIIASPEHPLMRELMTKAPGTYAHSVAAANLAEAGAEEIGADGFSEDAMGAVTLAKKLVMSDK